MRRLAFAAGLTLTLAAPASAFEHIQKINEVSLMSEGTTGNRFVELFDSVGESFPGTYKIKLYNPDGSDSGVEQVVDKAKFAFKTTPVLVAPGTVGGQTPDDTLTIALPPNGQLCFENGSATKIHCLRWGTITTPVGPGSTGPSPPDGQSLSLCMQAQLSPITPKAANNCSTGGTGGGGTGGGGTGGGGGGGGTGGGGGGTGGGGGGTGGSTTDTTKPRPTFSAKAQKLGAVLASGYKFKVKSNEKGRARAQLLRRGTVVATSTKSLLAAVAKSFSLRPRRSTRIALATARSATFVLKVRVTDAAGNVRNITRTVRLTR